MGYGAECVDNLDRANDVPVERIQVFGRDPILEMIAPTHLLHFVTIEKRCIDIKAGYETKARRLSRIPITRDLHGLRFREHGIENRLFRKSRRKRAKLQRFDQIEFASTNRTIERNDVHAGLFRRRLAHDGTYDPRRSVSRRNDFSVRQIVGADRAAVKIRHDQRTGS